MPRRRTSAAAKRTIKTEPIEGGEETAAVTAAAAAGAYDNEPPSCSVCLDDLSDKRELNLMPCNHLFHRTCVFEWLESRMATAEQVCPLCRSAVAGIKPHMGKEALYLFALGSSRLPTKNKVLWHSIDRHEPVDETLAHLISLTEKDTAVLNKHLDAATKSHDANSEYVRDVERELRLVKQKETIYHEMIKLFNDGGMRREHITKTDNPWNYNRELYDLRKRQYHAEKAGYDGYKKQMEESRGRLESLYAQIESLREVLNQPQAAQPDLIVIDDDAPAALPAAPAAAAALPAAAPMASAATRNDDELAALVARAEAELAAVRAPAPPRPRVAVQMQLSTRMPPFLQPQGARMQAARTPTQVVIEQRVASRAANAELRAQQAEENATRRAAERAAAAAESAARVAAGRRRGPLPAAGAAPAARGPSVGRGTPAARPAAVTAAAGATTPRGRGRPPNNAAATAAAAAQPAAVGRPRRVAAVAGVAAATAASAPARRGRGQLVTGSAAAAEVDQPGPSTSAAGGRRRAATPGATAPMPKRVRRQ